MGDLIRWLRRVRAFLKHELWREDLRNMKGLPRLGLAALRVAAHLLKAFTENLAGIRAAGLSLITLLALVPFLALVFSVANYFGLGDTLHEGLSGLATDLPGRLQEAVLQLRDLVQQANFGAIGTFGTVVVVWSAFVTFARVEAAFNHVWRVRVSRPWLRRLSDFVALVIILPPLFAAALFLQSVIASAQGMQTLPGWLEWLNPVIDAGYSFLPYPLTWIAFATLYKLMPGTSVRWLPAIWAGVVGGTAWLLLHDLYVRFQIGAVQANELYGSLAAIPLLVVYLQLTWTVILAGAEVSYAVQNIHMLRGAEHLPPAAFAIRKRLAWHVLHRSAVDFQEGRRGCDVGRLCRDMDVPREWLDGVVEALERGGLLVVPEGYQELVMPARPPEDIGMAEVILALENRFGAVEFLERVRLPEEQERELGQAEQAFAKAIAHSNFGPVRD